MALRDILDMDQVEAGIDKSWHAAGGGLDDDAAGGGGLDVARSDRRRRRHDHGGKIPSAIRRSTSRSATSLLRL